MVSSALTLHRYESGRESRVVTAVTMLKNHLQKYLIFNLKKINIKFRYGGYVGAALLLGGYDLFGPQLYTVILNIV